MTDPKLEIIPKKYSGESTVISMRITKAMLADIDKIAAETGRTRNELMSLGLEFALKHIKIIDKYIGRKRQWQSSNAKCAAATWRYPPTRPSEPANTAAVR